jgi:hypothetical protein
MMDTKAFLLFLLGMVLRLGIPVAVTIGVIALLRRLDRRWQKESLALPVIPAGKPCWEVKGCSDEKKKGCAAAANPQIPCWQVFRSGNGALKETCLGCDVFRQAPVPVKA